MQSRGLTTNSDLSTSTSNRVSSCPLCSRSRPQSCRSRIITCAQTQQSPPPQRPTPSGRITPSNAPRPEGQYSQSYPPPGPQYSQQPPFVPPPPQTPEGDRNTARDVLNNYAKALIAGAFVCGLGVGVYYDSEVVLSPQNLSSTQIIDRGSPNSDVCMAYGYSSSVFDMKLYVTYNPFNVYVTQPVIKSGCVLRRSNVGILERENLVEKKDVEQCKNRMNTFAFTGDLKNAPEVSCVYHSEEAENQYLRMSKDIMSGGSSNNAQSTGKAID